MPLREARPAPLSKDNPPCKGANLAGPLSVPSFQADFLRGLLLAAGARARCWGLLVYKFNSYVLMFVPTVVY